MVDAVKQGDDDFDKIRLLRQATVGGDYSAWADVLGLFNHYPAWCYDLRALWEGSDADQAARSRSEMMLTYRDGTCDLDLNIHKGVHGYCHLCRGFSCTDSEHCREGVDDVFRHIFSFLTDLTKWPQYPEWYSRVAIVPGLGRFDLLRPAVF
jgi:hypothetical protein